MHWRLFTENVSKRTNNLTYQKHSFNKKFLEVYLFYKKNEYIRFQNIFYLKLLQYD